MKEMADIITFCSMHESDVNDVERGQVFQKDKSVYIKIDTLNSNAVNLKTGMTASILGRCRVLGTIGIDI